MVSTEPVWFMADTEPISTVVCGSQNSSAVHSSSSTLVGISDTNAVSTDVVSAEVVSSLGLGAFLCPLSHDSFGLAYTNGTGSLFGLWCWNCGRMCTLLSARKLLRASLGVNPGDLSVGSEGGELEELEELKLELKLELVKIGLAKLELVKLKLGVFTSVAVFCSLESLRWALKKPRSATSESWIFDLSRCKISSVSFVKETLSAEAAHKHTSMPKRIAKRVSKVGSVWVISNLHCAQMH